METGLLARPRAREITILSTRALVAFGLAVITALAAALRFWTFPSVPPNPFYDAAVRSMSESWHNFFYGAFEPAAIMPEGTARREFGLAAPGLAQVETRVGAVDLIAGQA